MNVDDINYGNIQPSIIEIASPAEIEYCNKGYLTVLITDVVSQRGAPPVHCSFFFNLNLRTNKAYLAWYALSNKYIVTGEKMIFLTSDIHGKFDLLIRLLEKACFFEGENQLYILGDIIDRYNNGGVDIIKWIITSPNVELLLGNHEKMLLDSQWIFEDFSNVTIRSEMLYNLDRWKHSGGDYTIKALKHESPESRTKLLNYINTCSLYKTVFVNSKKYILIHGGLRNFSSNKDLSEYSCDDILWERPYLTTVYAPDEFTVILGHTPTLLYGNKYKNRILKTNSWWNIDTGACNENGYPMLLCLDSLSEYYLV